MKAPPRSKTRFVVGSGVSGSEMGGKFYSTLFFFILIAILIIFFNLARCLRKARYSLVWAAHHAVSEEQFWGIFGLRFGPYPSDPWRRQKSTAGPWTAGRLPLPDRGPCGPYPFLPVLPAEPRRLTKNKKIKKHMLLGASYVPEPVHSFKLVPENRSLRAE